MSATAMKLRSVNKDRPYILLEFRNGSTQMLRQSGSGDIIRSLIQRQRRYRESLQSSASRYQPIPTAGLMISGFEPCHPQMSCLHDLWNLVVLIPFLNSLARPRDDVKSHGLMYASFNELLKLQRILGGVDSGVDWCGRYVSNESQSFSLFE